MSGTLVSIALVLMLILIGGVFVATELALVSLRESQIHAMAARSKRGQRVAQVAEDPNRFLAAVQIGVTFAGFLSAAFGAATLADRVSPLLEDWGVPVGAAAAVALIIVTVIISYFSLVLSELAPKRLALQRGEAIALATAPAVDAFAKAMRPAIWLLSVSTNLVVRLIGGDPNTTRESISQDELRSLVATNEGLSQEERNIVDDVFAAGHRQIREVMLPRTEVDFLDAELPVFKAVKLASGRPHSRYPVMSGSPDEILGFVHVRDLFNPDVAARSVRVGQLVRDIVVLPDTKPVLSALSEMRRSGSHLALVADEYGGTAGIVTLEDLVEELVGDIRDEYDVQEGEAAVRPAGDTEIDGLLNLDDFRERTLVELPEGPYETVAGFLMAALGRLPKVGDEVPVDGHLLTVLELDGRRVSRLVLVQRPEVPMAGEVDDASMNATAAAVGAAGGVRTVDGDGAPGVRQDAPARD